MNEWWQQLYTADVAEALLDSPAAIEQASREVDFIVDVVGLSRGDVFDQCCGTGRLSKEFASRGFAVTAVDLIPDYVHSTKEKCQGLAVDVYRDDAFDFKPNKPMNLVVNWWTSFGYSQSDAVNLRMFERAFESLDHQGQFLLDFHNAAGVIRGFRETVTNQIAEKTLIRHSKLDMENRRLFKEWQWVDSQQRSTRHDSSVKLYFPDELALFAKQVGFSAVNFYGDIDGQALDMNSPRCIMHAIKQEA